MKNTKKIAQKPIVFSIVIYLIFLMPAYGLAEEINRTAAIQSAQKSLSNFVENVLTEKNVARFGFKSIQEARSAKVGDPLRVMMIGLKNLQEYKTGSRAASLFIDAKMLWFPVLVGEETRSTVEMMEKDGTLTPKAFGRAKTADKISSARRILPKLLETGNIREVMTTTLVRIPSLAAEFIYVESAQGEYFVPAMINPERLKIDEGKLYSAEELLSRLHEISKEINPNKVM